MDSTCLRHTEIPGTSRLFADLAYRFDKVARFFEHDPYGDDSFTRAAAQISYPDDRRAAMVKALAAQNPGNPLLEKFAKPGTVAVLTGQQVGLLSGPAYTVFKALTAVKLAEDLTARGIPAVPIFWLATEDHDFPEIASAWVYDTQRKPVKLSVPEPAGLSGKPQPVGGLPADAPIEALREALSGFPFAKEVLAAVEDAYAQPATMASGFRKLLVRLLGSAGVLTIDPLDPAVRAIGAPFMAQALKSAPELKAGLLQRNKELADAGYHAQVLIEPKTSLFFLLENGERKTLRMKDEEFVSLADRAADVSPNALLRPVWEDYLLPTVCYVGGPGELAYLAQSSVLYKQLLGRMPVVLPRAGYTLVDARAEKLLGRHKLRVPEILCRPDQLREKVAHGLVPSSLTSDFAATSQHLQNKLDSLQREVENFDPTLGSALTKSRAKILYQLEKSRLKVERETLRRDAQSATDAEFLTNTFYPHAHLQERFYSILPFLAQHGMDVVGRIHESLRWDCPDHRIAEI
jgi:bacillithiol biosynthesis cysteine-adding enzyme BshC